jgi:predicted transcriptional regulator
MTGATRSERGKLGGLKRLQVMRELAAGELTQRQLAEKYDVTQAAISQFGTRYATEIGAIKANMADEFAGILIAQKQARLAAYEEIAAIALTRTPKVGNNGKVVKHVNEDGETETLYEVDGRLAAQVMKQAAEEMGQLAARVQVSGDLSTTTTYRVEGVSPEDLK